MSVESELQELRADLTVASGRVADAQNRLDRVLSEMAGQSPAPAPLTVAASAGVEKVTIAWMVDPSRAVIALVTGRDGPDGGWSTVELLGARSRTFDKLTGGFAYRFTVRAEYAGGTSETVEVVATPAAAPVVVVVPAGSRRIPLVGRSKLPWNSGAFVADQWQQPAVNAFGTWRGRPVDTMLVFATWDGATWEQLLNVPTSWQGWPGILVISLPPQPGPASNATTAAGSNNGRWRDYGVRLKAAGMNHARTVLRLGWECNGDWYPWSWPKGGTAQFVAAFRQVVEQVRISAPEVRFDLCLNKDWAADQWRGVLDALRGHVDVVGLDAYDMWDGWRGSDARAAAWNSKQPGRDTIATYCRDHGLQMSLDEWGLVAAASAGSGGTGGGDDPLYITRTWDWLQANRDIVAWESYYQHAGAPADLLHELTRYPNSAAAYRAPTRWGS